MKRKEVVKVANLMALIADMMSVEYNDFRSMKSDWYDTMLEKRESGEISNEEFEEVWDTYLSGETWTAIDSDAEALRKAAKGLVASYDQFVKAKAKVEELYNRVRGGK